MFLKIHLLCLVATILPWCILASRYLPCTTVDSCMGSMRHEMGFSRFDAFIQMNKALVQELEDAARLQKISSPIDATKNQDELDKIIEKIEELHETFDNLGKLNDEKLSKAYNDVQKLKEQVMQATDNENTRNYPDLEIEIQLKYLNRLFDIWKDAASLRNNIEIPGFIEINQEVEKAKALPSNKENLNYFNEVRKRILSFYDLKDLEIM